MGKRLRRHPRRAALTRWGGFLLLAGLLAPPPASAHDFTTTEVRLRLGPGEAFAVAITCDLDALALGASQTADSSRLAAVLAALPPGELEVRIDRLRALFQRRVRIRFDGAPAPFEVLFPDHATVLRPDTQVPTVLGTHALLTGRMPAGAGSVTFFASRAFPPVRLTVTDSAGEERAALILERGEESPPVPLAGPAPVPGRLATAGRYLVLGFRHILPEGLDHILFVLGLFLLSTRLRPLLWQVSAFTLAHTLTLALSTYGAVSLPSRPVEALIAASIAYVAVENVLTSRLKPWRVAVVFAFGLLHGLGFAGVLAELGLPRERALTALLSFNAGVELGQLAVILLAFAALGWWRQREGYRRWVTVPLSLAIAAVGLWWTVERAFAG